MKRIQSHSLKRNVLIACGISITTLGIFASVLGGIMYHNNMIKKNQDYLAGIIHYCISQIDGDDLESCIETKEKSDLFLREKQMLDDVKKSHKAEYLYIVKPLNTDATDNMLDVMSGETERDRGIYSDSEVVPGVPTGTAYTAEIAAKYLAGMDNKPGEVSYFENKTEFGYDYTGLSTIFNSQGEAVAVLAADIPINDIRGNMIRYFLLIMAGTLVLILLFLTGIYRWMNANIVAPIERIGNSAQNFVKVSHGENDPDKIEFMDPQIYSRDELEALSDSMMTMASDLKLFMKNLLAETSMTFSMWIKTISQW